MAMCGIPWLSARLRAGGEAFHRPGPGPAGPGSPLATNSRTGPDRKKVAGIARHWKRAAKEQGSIRRPPRRLLALAGCPAATPDSLSGSCR